MKEKIQEEINKQEGIKEKGKYNITKQDIKDIQDKFVMATIEGKKELTLTIKEALALIHLQHSLSYWYVLHFKTKQFWGIKLKYKYERKNTRRNQQARRIKQ